MASEQLTLMEFIRLLLGTGSESIQMRDYYNQDPQAALDEHGLGHLTPEDIRDAMVLLQDNDTVSFDRSYDTGFDWDGGQAGWAWTPAAEGHHDGGHHDGGHHDGGHAAEHVTRHVTDNHYTYDVDDRDTIVDNSVNQNVDTGGGDFRQDIETTSVTASGDGAVAAGDDIDDSVITTGDGNIVGDGNDVVSGDGNIVGDGNDVVSGDGNTTAFGSGDATSTGDVTADDGAAISFGGDADGEKSAVGSFNDTTNTTTTTNGTSFDDSFNTETDDSTSVTNTDSGNTSVGSGNEIDLDLTV